MRMSKSVSPSVSRFRLRGVGQIRKVNTYVASLTGTTCRHGGSNDGRWWSSDVTSLGGHIITQEVDNYRSAYTF
jgi:hypothetical protein